MATPKTDPIATPQIMAIPKFMIGGTPGRVCSSFPATAGPGGPCVKAPNAVAAGIALLVLDPRMYWQDRLARALLLSGATKHAKARTGIPNRIGRGRGSDRRWTKTVVQSGAPESAVTFRCCRLRQTASVWSEKTMNSTPTSVSMPSMPLPSLCDTIVRLPCCVIV